MEYRFPASLTNCPIYACRKEFGIRASAIDHFKSRHSKNSVFCEVCVNVISAKCRLTFAGHYKSKHPDVEPPLWLKKPILKEDKVRNSFFFRRFFRKKTFFHKSLVSYYRMITLMMLTLMIMI